MTKTPKTMPRMAVHASLGLVHRTASPALRDALHRLPTWTEVLDQLRRLDETAPPPRNVGTLEENVDAVVIEALRDGGGVPEDLTQRVAEMRGLLSSHMEAQAALERVRSQLSADLDAAVRGHLDDLLADLHAQLASVLTEARALGDLVTIGDADAAVTSRRVDDYHALQRLGERHGAVRSAQRMLMRHVDGQERPFYEALLMPSVETAFPAWRTWRTTGYLVDRHSGRRKDCSPPWPQDVSRLDPLGSMAGGMDFLVWAVRSDVEMWVPTTDQLAAEEGRLHELIVAAADRYQPTRTERDNADPEPEWVDPQAPRGALA